MLMKVLDRWALVTLLPEKGNLATQLIVDDLRKKLLMNAEEQEELQMTTGVVCNKCNAPVENRGDAENPSYYCLVCDEFVDDTRGLENRTVWSQEADEGKEIKFNKAERSIFIQVFTSLDKNDAIEPQHVAIWKMLAAEYPKSFTPPNGDDDDDEDEE